MGAWGACPPTENGVDFFKAIPACKLRSVPYYFETLGPAQDYICRIQDLTAKIVRKLAVGENDSPKHSASADYGGLYH